MTGSDIINWSVDADVLDSFRREYGPDPASVREEAETAMADHCGCSRVARLYEIQFPPEDDHREGPSERSARKKKIDFSRKENFGKRVDADVADAFRSYTKQHTENRYGEELSHALYAHLYEPLDEKYERRLHEEAGEEVSEETTNEPLSEVEEPTPEEKPIEALPGADNDLLVASFGPVDVRQSFENAIDTMQRETDDGIKDWKALGPRVQKKAARAIHHILDNVHEPMRDDPNAPLPNLKRDDHIVPAIVSQQDSDSPNSDTIEKYESIVTRALQHSKHPVQQTEFKGEPVPDGAVERYADRYPTSLVDERVCYLPPEPERLREAKQKTREVIESIRKPGKVQKRTDEYGHGHGDADETMSAVTDPANYASGAADD